MFLAKTRKCDILVHKRHMDIQVCLGVYKEQVYDKGDWALHPALHVVRVKPV